MAVPDLIRTPDGGVSALRRIHRQIAAARADSARLRATPRSGPRRRLPLSSTRGSSIGGNRPKLTFIGWNERGPASIASIWPPVMWLSSAPIAVVGGGGASARPSRSAAAKRPAIRPIAALST